MTGCLKAILLPIAYHEADLVQGVLIHFIFCTEADIIILGWVATFQTSDIMF